MTFWLIKYNQFRYFHVIVFCNEACNQGHTCTPDVIPVLTLTGADIEGCTCCTEDAQIFRSKFLTVNLPFFLTNCSERALGAVSFQCQEIKIFSIQITKNYVTKGLIPTIM